MCLNGLDDELTAAARLALFRTGAIKECGRHQEVNIRLGDHDAERDAYNHRRPHSSLGYRPPAPGAWLNLPADTRSASPVLRGGPADPKVRSAVT